MKVELWNKLSIYFFRNTDWRRHLVSVYSFKSLLCQSAKHKQKWSNEHNVKIKVHLSGPMPKTPKTKTKKCIFIYFYKAIAAITLTVIMSIIFIWVACGVVILKMIWQHLFWLGNFILENTHDKEPYCYGLFKDIHNMNVRSQCSTMLPKTLLCHVFYRGL